jgi:predicted Zn-dependent protease
MGLTAGLLVAGCESTNLGPNLGTGPTPVRLADDEQRLWTRSQEEQAAIERSGFRPALPDLDAYLTSLARRLHSAPLPEGRQWHVRVLVDPTLNAFALPDGVIYIHTGMLARMENEAQLATVLGHELTHATHRHAVKGFRNLKNQAAFYATFTVGTGGVGGLLGLVGAMSAVSGYSQELEREADREGFALLRAAGYDPRESPKVFRLLLSEAKRTKTKQPYFFGSHPRLEERIASYEALVGALPESSSGRTEADRYLTAVLPALSLNAEAALRNADYDFARDCANRALAARPDAPDLLFILAEIPRRRGTGNDDTLALQACEHLRARHPDFPETYRSLGLLHLRAARRPDAATAFRRYLELRPAAPDRAYIDQLLKQCTPET